MRTFSPSGFLTSRWHPPKIILLISGSPKILSKLYIKAQDPFNGFRSHSNKSQIATIIRRYSIAPKIRFDGLNYRNILRITSNHFTNILYKSKAYSCRIQNHSTLSLSALRQLYLQATAVSLSIYHRQLFSIHGPVPPNSYLDPFSLPSKLSSSLPWSPPRQTSQIRTPFSYLFILSSLDTCSTTYPTRPGRLTSIFQLNVPQAHQSHHRYEFSSHTLCYTDGSKSGTRTGFAFSINGIVTHHRHRNSASIFPAELLAIYSCLSHLSLLPPPHKFLLLSDSLSSIQAMQDPHSPNPIVQRILILHHSLSSSSSSCAFLWIPGHINLPDHDAVNFVAKCRYNLVVISFD